MIRTRRFRRQSSRVNLRRLVDGAVRLSKRTARAIDAWLDDDQILPKPVEHAALRVFAFYFVACAIIWTAVYFQANSFNR